MFIFECLDCLNKEHILYNMEYAIQKWLIGTSFVPIRQKVKKDVIEVPYIQTIESKCLMEAKFEIEKYYEDGLWDDYKKITNNFEYVYLSWNKRSSRSVCNYSPLSRSYFKMIEMWKMINIDKELESLIERDEGFYSAHGAEGPGGFIEGCVNMCKKKRIDFEGASAITLFSEDKTVPGWKKATTFLRNNENVHISYGKDETGNLMNIENIDFFCKKMKDDFGKKAHLYTADGGFDFSDNYSAQEKTVFKLLFAEVLLGLQCLAKGGIMIIKCFDTNEIYSAQLLYCVSSLFRTFGIVKPNTSRVANAERYFIGVGYSGFDETKYMYDFLLEVYKELKEPFSFLENSIDKDFKQMLFEVQQTIEKNEYDNILKTIELIEKHDMNSIRNYVRMNVYHSLEWCIFHEENINSLWKRESIEKQIIEESIELMNILHPEKHKMPYVKKNVSWFVKSEGKKISFEDFGKRRMKTEDEIIRHE